MFLDLDHARDALTPEFDAAELEAVLGALVPAITMAPAIPSPPPHVERDKIGGTRIGGVPDLPPGLAWPRPPAPEDAEVIAGRGSAEAGAAMRRHLAEGLPYAFMAQVDLAEAAALGPVAADLPGDGRLLFFYDYLSGPWDTGTRSARVIWDRAPRGTLRPAEPPTDLLAAAQRWRAEDEAAWAEAAPAFEAQHGIPRTHVSPNATVYGAPGQARALLPVLRLPQPRTLEMERLPALSDDERYGEVVCEQDYFDHDRDRRQQLLGGPMPEQRDPRREAARFTLFGRQYPTEDEGAREETAIDAEERRWRLLLQLDLADWSTDDLVEGTVYFLIRAEELAARRFDGVVAVYQQT